MLSFYYDILELPENASDDDIRRAYRRKAKEFHPDLNKAPDANARFLQVKRAYEVLLNRHNYFHRATVYSNPMSSFEAYMAHKRAKEEKAEQEARERYQEFLKNREKFRTSHWYYPTLAFLYFASFFCYLFSAAVIILCAYVIHKTHIIFVLLMLPFISGSIYFIKSTGNWYKEAKKYF